MKAETQEERAERYKAAAEYIQTVCTGTPELGVHRITAALLEAYAEGERNIQKQLFNNE